MQLSQTEKLILETNICPPQSPIKYKDFLKAYNEMLTRQVMSKERLHMVILLIGGKYMTIQELLNMDNSKIVFKDKNGLHATYTYESILGFYVKLL